MLQTIDVLSSTMASTFRAWRGTRARPVAKQPDQVLELYDFEGCPYCRLTREALTELDLDAMIYPCPRGGTRFRPRVTEMGGKQQFPFLVDPNTGTELYESLDIVRYLERTYDGSVLGGDTPLTKPLSVATSQFATFARRLRGIHARPSKRPEQPLELYSFESSPYSRIVREVLCEFEIPYLLRSMGKAQGPDMGPPWMRETFFPNAPVLGRNRKRLHERTGRLQVPYLIDPNTNTEMFESRDIVRYLEETYG